MESFYINKEKKEVKPYLFSKTAEEIAKGFIGGHGKYYGVSKTQLRRFYDEVKRFEQNLDGTVETWKKNFPYIKMIKSKTSYNIARAIEKNRNEADVYNKLSAFISDGLEQIEDEKDYNVFTSLFEAVYGFYYKETIDKNIRGN
jgi:CRISPR-associated protein Csm2